MTVSDVIAGLMTLWLMPLTIKVHLQDKHVSNLDTKLDLIHEDVKLIKEKLYELR